MSNLIRMTPEQARRCRALIKNQCCNYDNGNCILLDDGDPCVCPQSISCSLNCKWFRKAVLPNNMELYIKITKPKNTKKCVICNKLFIYNSNRAKYCSKCRNTVIRRQKADYQRKRRQNNK